jgi:RHS repeat-associated protein
MQGKSQIFIKSGAVAYINEYYPFGLQNQQTSSTQYGSKEQRYKYNGKELFKDFKLEMEDYGARMYSPQIGRWSVIDKKASDYTSYSPYNYVMNRPTIAVDPDGNSAEVVINKEQKTITIQANLVFYGEASSASLAQQTAADIQNLWNGANGKTSIDGVEYNVVFNVSGEHRDTEGPIDAASFLIEKSFNDDIKNNFIEVKNTVDGGVSNMQQSGNEGTFQLNNINGKGTTTEAHEFGHSLGLWPGTSDGHPGGSLVGKGQPGIMYPRGTLVDSKFQYDPKAKSGEKGGTLNPNTRKVVQKDIDALGLDKLKFKDNKSKLGNNTSGQ